MPSCSEFKETLKSIGELFFGSDIQILRTVPQAMAEISKLKRQIRKHLEAIDLHSDRLLKFKNVIIKKLYS